MSLRNTRLFEKLNECLTLQQKKELLIFLAAFTNKMFYIDGLVLIDTVEKEMNLEGYLLNKIALDEIKKARKKAKINFEKKDLYALEANYKRLTELFGSNPDDVLLREIIRISDENSKLITEYLNQHIRSQMRKFRRIKTDVRTLLRQAQKLGINTRKEEEEFNNGKSSM